MAASDLGVISKTLFRYGNPVSAPRESVAFREGSGLPTAGEVRVCVDTFLIFRVQFAPGFELELRLPSFYRWTNVRPMLHTDRMMLLRTQIVFEPIFPFGRIFDRALIVGRPGEDFRLAAEVPHRLRMKADFASDGKDLFSVPAIVAEAGRFGRGSRPLDVVDGSEAITVTIEHNGSMTQETYSNVQYRTV
jgi:hypothetical protein